MLTKSEREWLASHRTFCNYCDLERGSDDCYWNHVVEACPMYPNIKDALEFSERVVARLANREGCIGDWCYYYPFSDKVCPACILKHVRLAVEKEMDNEP